jgi:hypothetical protein
MNRELFKHKIFLENEVKSLKENLKTINNHLKNGKKIYDRHKNHCNKTLLNAHKQQMKKFRVMRTNYKNRLNNLNVLRIQFNDLIRELQPSTSGRKTT